jgi:hypothetical protein
MSSSARAALPPLNPRAEASRRNGAKSRGPRTAQGKARSSRNALKHGLRAETFVAFGDEDQEAFEALEAALEDELAPQGVLQRLLVGRIARAAWRLERAERMEGELLGCHCGVDGNLGLALIRDGRGARAFETLLRYRGAATAELSRALRCLKALQAEARSEAAEVAAAQRMNPPAFAHPSARPTPPIFGREQPKEPKDRTNLRDSTRLPTTTEPGPYTAPQARRPAISASP